MVIVRRVRPDDAASLRELRLKALQSDPDAFGSSYEVEMGQPADKWVNRAGSASTGSTQFIAVADEDGRLIGMAGGYEPDDAPADGELWGMWVAPEWRGRGIGADLVRSVVDWATAAGAERLTLWVVTTNTPGPVALQGGRIRRDREDAASAVESRPLRDRVGPTTHETGAVTVIPVSSLSVNTQSEPSPPELDLQPTKHPETAV